MHLADKLVKDERRVSLSRRFGITQERKGRTPEARAAIQRRWDLARRIAERVEAVLGESLEACLSREGLGREDEAT